MVFDKTVDSGAFRCVVGPLNSNTVCHVRAYIRQGSGAVYAAYERYNTGVGWDIAQRKKVGMPER
jgi:hypothetical protein